MEEPGEYSIKKDKKASFGARAILSLLLQSGIISGCNLEGIRPSVMPDVRRTEVTGTQQPSAIINGELITQFPYYLGENDKVIAHPPELAEIAPQLIEQAKAATVIIAPVPNDQLDSEGNVNLASVQANFLSGFRGADGKIYSSLHAFTESGSLENGTASSAIIIDGTNVTLANDIFYEPGYDIVRIDTPDNAEWAHLDMVNSLPASGETVYVSGFKVKEAAYELGTAVPNGFRAIFAGKSGGTTEFGLSDLRTGLDPNSQFNISEPGWSGGPVLNSLGQVIGIVRGTEHSRGVDGSILPGLLISETNLDSANTISTETIGPCPVSSITSFPPQFSVRLGQ